MQYDDYAVADDSTVLCMSLYVAVVYIMHIACFYDVLVQDGLTALHISIFRGQLNAMRALVNEFHLDPDVVDKVSIMLCDIFMCFVIVHS